MTTDPPPAPRPLTETDEILTADPLVEPPLADARRTDELGIRVDGTSALHDGTSAPALSEEGTPEPD
ncbi:hypothetical protein [Deinococcus rufus]|uniref:Uncharacterized protein n=1 Tax=Deinococcus rufus TaxID=2136097 RepID=A0ABV7ZAR7_9DEIO